MSQDSPEVHMVARAAQDEQTRDATSTVELEIPALLLGPPPDLIRGPMELPGSGSNTYGFPYPPGEHIPGPTRRSRTHTGTRQQEFNLFLIENTTSGASGHEAYALTMFQEPVDTTGTESYEGHFYSPGSTANLELPVNPTASSCLNQQVFTENSQNDDNLPLGERGDTPHQLTADPSRISQFQLPPVFLNFKLPVGEVSSSSSSIQDQWTARYGPVEAQEGTGITLSRTSTLQNIYVPSEDLPPPATQLFELEQLMLQNLVELPQIQIKHL